MTFNSHRYKLIVKNCDYFTLQSGVLRGRTVCQILSKAWVLLCNSRDLFPFCVIDVTKSIVDRC